MGERKLKVVLDTNVLISALGWSGPPSDCWDLVIEEKILNFISKPIIEELIEVMDYPKFKFSESEKEQFIEVLISYSILVEPEKNLDVIDEDPDDNKFLECSLKAEVDYIISGDQHVLDLERYEGIKIVDPKEFIEIT